MSSRNFTKFLTICWFVLIISFIFPVQRYSEQIFTLDSKISYIDLSGNPIYIDNLDPDHNWEEFTFNNPWCTGTGKIGDPYLISNVILDANNEEHCIAIKNSEVIFVIKNCILYNTNPYEISPAIYLNNVTGGSIRDSQIFQNGYSGIKAIDCNNIVVYQNTINDNEVTGIYFGNVSGGIIQKNIINNHSGDGVFLFNSFNIFCVGNIINNSKFSGIWLNVSQSINIEDNYIYCSYQGISLSYSSNNIITKNHIYNSDDTGIFISYYSHYNSLTYNTLQNYQYCISIGTSCQETYLNYNNPCEIWSHEDIPEPRPDPDPDPPELPEDNSTNNEDDNIDNSELLSGYDTFLLSSCIIISVSIIIYIKKKVK